MKYYESKPINDPKSRYDGDILLTTNNDLNGGGGKIGIGMEFRNYDYRYGKQDSV